MPPNRHFASAGGSARTAEMAQLQWIARLLPPRAICSLLLLSLQYILNRQEAEVAKIIQRVGIGFIQIFKM